MQLIPLEEYSKLLDKEAAMLEAKFEDAQNFLEMGLSVEQVARGTGLSIEDIRDLQQ